MICFVVTASVKFDEKIFHQIASRVGQEWKVIATALDIPYSEIQKIILDNPSQTDQQIVCMFLLWSHRHQGIEPERVLKKALRAANRNDIAADVDGNFCATNRTLLNARWQQIYQVNPLFPSFWACSHFKEQWIYMAVCCHLVSSKVSHCSIT